MLNDCLVEQRTRKSRATWRVFFSSIAVLTLVGITTTVVTTKDFGDREGDDERDGRGTYAIGLWGDLPYSDLQATTGVPNLIADMNRQDLEFTVHDGDLKVGSGVPGG